MATVPKRIVKCISTIDRSPAFGRPTEEVRCQIVCRSGRWVAEFKVYRYAKVTTTVRPGEQPEYAWRATTRRVDFRVGETATAVEAMGLAEEYLRDLNRPGRPKGRAASMLSQG